MADVRFELRPAQLAAFWRSSDGTLGSLLLSVAQDVEGRAKRFCPVDTGRLRSSITSELGKDADSVYAQVGTDVEYAPYVEYGTMRMVARSFLRRALDEVTRGV